MKLRARHPEKALTAVKLRTLTTPGRYADGNGLYLVVDPSGSKRWILRIVVQRRRRDMGLGGLSLVSLAEAREKALQYRKIARADGDPIAERRKAQMATPTFAEAACAVHAEHRSAWKNAKHAAQWISTLSAYAFPIVGDLRVDHIETPEILRVLSPIWLTKPETARRLKQRIRTVLDWAKAAGFRSGENPVNGVAKGLPRQPDRKQHHSALPYAEIPSFIRALHASHVGEPIMLAFEFLILTATRTSEVLQAKWPEIDTEQAVWVIPAERMKAGREHRVPLAGRCLEILARAQELAAGSDHVFPGRSARKPMSNMVFLMTLRRMNLKVTAHGFRSAFRDWAAERTNFPREVCEMSLAHTIKDKTEAAYRRGDLLDRRRLLMNAWGSYVTTGSGPIVRLQTKHVAAKPSL
jgi:integrase